MPLILGSPELDLALQVFQRVVSRGKDHLPRLCLVQLRRLLAVFGTGVQGWLMFILSTRTPRSLSEKLLSS